MIIPQIILAGAEKVTAELACGIDGNRYKVHLIIINERKENRLQHQLDAKGVECHFYGHKEKNGFKRKVNQLKWMFRVLDEIKPDIIHTNLDYYFSWIYALVRRKRIITTFHSQSYRIRLSLFRLLNAGSLISSILLTESNAQEFSACFHADLNKIYVLPNFVDTNTFAFPNRKYQGSSEIHFVFVARFCSVKNHHMLIRAFYELLQEYPDCRLTLVGSGELLETEKTYAGSLGIVDSIDFMGEVPDPVKILRSVEVAVISSRSEAFPLALIEAMAAGLPVIVTDVGGMRDVVDGNGIKVRDNDYHEFAKAMKQLVQNPQLRQQYGVKSVELARKYDRRKVIEDYKRIYEKELSRGSRA